MMSLKMVVVQFNEVGFFKYPLTANESHRDARGRQLSVSLPRIPFAKPHVREAVLCRPCRHSLEVLPRLCRHGGEFRAVRLSHEEKGRVGGRDDDTFLFRLRACQRDRPQRARRPKGERVRINLQEGSDDRSETPLIRWIALQPPDLKTLLLDRGSTRTHTHRFTCRTRIR